MLRFESNASCVGGENILGNVEGSHVLVVADNVRHNSVTINGENLFYGMSIIAAITPSTFFTAYSSKKNCRVTDAAKVQIHDYKVAKNIL